MIAQQVSVGEKQCLQVLPYMVTSTVKEVLPSKSPQRTLPAFLSPPFLLLEGRGANLKVPVDNHLLVGGVTFKCFEGVHSLSVLPVMSYWDRGLVSLSCHFSTYTW